MRRTVEQVIKILEKHGLRCSWDGLTSVIELLDCQGNTYQSIIWEGTYLRLEAEAHEGNSMACGMLSDALNAMYNEVTITHD